MRPIDADNLRGRVCEIFLCAEPGSAEERRFALVLGLIDSEPTISPPPNAPLTLEELREMDGEPVWVETADVKRANRWAFVDVGCEIIRFFETRCGVKCAVMGNHFRTYGKTWLAYRRRPKEGTV